MMSDDGLTSEFGIWTTELETWMQKSLMVDHSQSKVYARTADGQLMKVTSVRIDSQGDLLFGIEEFEECDQVTTVDTMEFEIRRELTIYKRERQFAATDDTKILLPTFIGGKSAQFQVRTVWVDCVRDGEHEPWYVSLIRAIGPVIKKNGEPGLIDRSECWGRVHRSRPTWVAKLARDFLVELEQERMAGKRKDHREANVTNYGRCEAHARKGTGSGICDRPLNRHGYCDRASDHLELR